MKPRRLSAAIIPFGILLIVVIMVVPMPVVLLDLLLASNLSLSIMILLTAMLVREPLEFSVFPALLLVTTLMRLALNVSSTRLILSEGEGGKVIEAFGSIVISGDLIIGLIVFLILVIIQFAVVTSGAGRVAEVGARFTLDAMPGKQMAIDADLNAGLITETEARNRRVRVGREADFYGSMDGASKFIKGDAIASVVIVLVNLLGGIAVGVFQNKLSVGDSINRYALLSVGDGLVSQIPALLISVASGVIVTRSTTDEEGGLGVDLASQLLGNRRVLGISAAAVFAVGIIPGLPKAPFFILAAVLLIARTRAQDSNADSEPIETRAVGGPESSDEDLARELLVEPLELDLAIDLVDLVDPGLGAPLLERVRGLRRQLAREVGIVVPLVRTRDDLLLTPGSYVIRVNGVDVARGEAPAGQVLVLADVDEDVVGGRATSEPVFGLPAYWVPDALADHHRSRGATVVDRSSVVVTHLADVVRRNAPSLVSRQDVASLLETIKQQAPSLVESIGSSGLSLADVHEVLRSLLSEGVPIRDLVRILEAITAKSRDTRDVELLAEAARQAIAPALCAQAAIGNTISAITFDPSLEYQLIQARRMGEGGWYLELDAARLEAVMRAIAGAIARAQSVSRRPTVVCAPPLRPIVRRLVGNGAAAPRVLSYNELSPSVTVEYSEVIDLAGSDTTV